MKKQEKNPVKEAKMRLIEAAGRTTQDLGMGRIIGQVMAAAYLTEGECSLDDIGKMLGLSKAAVSIASRQLENLGLIQRVWRSGDRKNYYKTADNFAQALQRGVLELLRNKLRTAGAELDYAEEYLKAENGNNSEAKFLRNRLNRANYMRKRVLQILDSPILKLLGR